MASKYTDTTAVVQVIGTVLGNSHLLNNEKYFFLEEDFSDNFHKVVFGALYQLNQLGAKKIRIESVVDFLSDRPSKLAIFNSRKGEEFLVAARECASLSTFDYYYNRLKKMTLLREFENIGVDMSQYYDANNILDVKKKQQQEDWLDNTPLSKIADQVMEGIDNIKAKYIDDAENESEHVSSGLKNLKETLKETPEVGVPLYGGLINGITRGARLKKFYLRSAATGTGKAIPNDTVIPTPDGYKQVKDIRQGDLLFGKDGKPTTVLQIHPQKDKKQAYKVIFSDGREALCCEDHLWEYKYFEHGNWSTRVESAGDILKRVEKLKNRFRDSTGFRFRVPLNSPVEYKEKEYSVEPYLMGFLLGSENYDKFIPASYLEGSIQQRYDLLAGLLDKGGSIVKGRVNFTTASEKLVGNIVELCHSLGFKTCVSEDARKDKYSKSCWNIHIECKKEIKEKLFKLSRKVELAKNYIGDGKRSEHKDYIAIVDIVPTNEFYDMTCFTVDNEDHLFLMNDFIVTHNTRSMIADACYIACNELYDETYGWIKNGTSESVLFIATEQELEEVQTMMIAFISNVNEERIISASYTSEEEERIDKAIEILTNSKLYIELLPDFGLKDIENTIKRNIREHECSFVFLDYIHTSLKILEEISQRTKGMSLREDNILFMISIRLKDLCNEYGIFIMSATQLNTDWTTSKTPDQNLLRGAKSIADKIDFGSIILSVTEEDIASLGNLSGFEVPTLKISIYKNRRGKFKGVFLWCKADLGTCRIEPMFMTSWNYKLIDSSSLVDIKINVTEF